MTICWQLATISAAGSGCIVWSGFPQSRSYDGHQRSYYCTALTLAERLCGGASLALSVASVSAACFRLIFAITTRRERIYRLTRIARRPVRYTCPPRARSSRSQKLVACIIVTSVARREFSQRPNSRVHFGAGGRLICNSVARMRLAPRHHTCCRGHRPGHCSVRPMDNRQSQT